jgi:hypothetical protein
MCNNKFPQSAKILQLHTMYYIRENFSLPSQTFMVVQLFDFYWQYIKQFNAPVCHTSLIQNGTAVACV